MLLSKNLYFFTLVVIGLLFVSFDGKAYGQAAIQLSLPTNATGTTGGIASIPITLTNTNPPQAVSSYTIDVTFNPNVLEPLQPTAENTDPAVDRTNTLSGNCGFVIQFTGTPGKFNVTATGCLIGGSGTLIKMLFKVVGTAGSATAGTTNLTFTRSALERGEGKPASVVTAPGIFTVTSSATVNSVKLSGRILTPDNRGLRGAQVRLVTSDGSSKTVISGAFGHYRFADVQTGQSVTVQIFSKRYRFEPQNVNVSGEMSDLNFTAVPLSIASKVK